jgi:hypothetical protein
VNVSTGKKQLDRIANPIDKSVDFRVFSASRNTNILVGF